MRRLRLPPGRRRSNAGAPVRRVGRLGSDPHCLLAVQAGLGGIAEHSQDERHPGSGGCPSMQPRPSCFRPRSGDRRPDSGAGFHPLRERRWQLAVRTAQRSPESGREPPEGESWGRWHPGPEDPVPACPWPRRPSSSPSTEPSGPPRSWPAAPLLPQLPDSTGWPGPLLRPAPPPTRRTPLRVPPRHLWDSLQRRCWPLQP